MLGADGVLRPGGGGAGSGQLCYLGYRGAIYLCGLTCFCRLGDPETDSAEVDLFILPNRTRPGLEGRNWGSDQRFGPPSKTRASRESCRGVGGGEDASSERPVNQHSLSTRTSPAGQEGWTLTLRRGHRVYLSGRYVQGDTKRVGQLSYLTCHQASGCFCRSFQNFPKRNQTFWDF